MTIFKRAATSKILASAKYFPVIAILGPRQSGKTTLAQTIFKQHRYLSLEDLDLRAAAQHDPRSFLIANSNVYGIIIDEFQLVPDLLSYIQTTVDQQKQPGYFILTGSQNFLMNKAITQSLAGRVSIHTLLPLSLAELSANQILPAQIETMLYQGNYPAIYAQQVPANLLYKNYLQTYIERDVRQLSQVGDLALFQTFITLCAARMGQPLNITALGNDCGISNSTVNRWLSILQASYIIVLLQPYHHANLGKRLVKTPKLYFYDTGLACHLLRIKLTELDLHPSRGNLFEALIIAETFKYYFNHNQTPSIYFWRDQAGHEVDCILDEGQQVIPIEIKASRTISQRFFENLKLWQATYPAQQQLSSAHSEQSRTRIYPEPGYIVYAGTADQPRGQTNVVSWQSLSQILNYLP